MNNHATGFLPKSHVTTRDDDSSAFDRLAQISAAISIVSMTEPRVEKKEELNNGGKGY